MKTGLKNFIKGIIVVVVFASALLCAGRILMLKSEDGYVQMRAFYRQKKDTVDVLFLGSSRVFCDVDTGVLWDDYGIASFNLCGAEAPTWNALYYMDEALKTQTPKLIVYDASMIAYRHDLLYQTEKWVILNSYGMKWNENRIKMIRQNCETDAQFKRLLFPLDTMHLRYNELEKNDFVNARDSINYKGFSGRFGVTALERPTAADISGELPVFDIHIDYLKQMAELANKNNIPFLVIMAPSTITDEEEMMYNYIRRVCEGSEIMCIDFNKYYDEIGLDFSTDMADPLHTNYTGAKKYSDYLGKYIKDNYDIPDRRGDEVYKSWDIDAAENRRLREISQNQ